MRRCFFLLLLFLPNITFGQRPELVLPIGHSDGVLSVVFSPDGQSILTGSRDNTAILWNLQGEQIQEFKGHTSAVLSVAFSPDGQFILTGSADNTAILWNLKGEQIQEFKGHADSVLSVAFSPDGQFILTGSADSTAILWNLQGEQIQEFKGHAFYLSSVAFSPDGQFILTGSEDNTAILWNLQGEQIQEFKGHASAVLSVAFSPDGQSILTCSWDSTAILWNLQGEQIQAFKGHAKNVYSVAFSPDGQSILTGSDNTAILWNLKGEQIKTFRGHGSGVNSVTFSPDGQSILTGSADKTAILWNLKGEQIQASTDYSTAPSPDGQSRLTIGYDSTATLWNLQGEQIQTFKGHGDLVLSVAFSPACPAGIDCPGGNGQSILTGSRDNTAILWNLQGESLQTFKGHIAPVLSVAFSPDGQSIATGSSDNTAKLWERETGKEIASLLMVGTEDWIITTPSGLFDASPGAMTLMHYVVFYEGKYEVIELEQLKARYYEPGLLAKVTGFSKERIRPIENFDAVALYPAVEAEIRADSLSIELKERNGGIGKVSIFINGKEVVEEVNPLPRRENPKRNSSIRYDLKQHQNYLLQHPDSTNVISIRAYNEEGWLKSRAIHLDYKTPLASGKGTGRSSTHPRSRRNQRPKLYVVSIGTSDYTGEEMDLQYADQDATSMALALQSVGGALFSNGDSLEIHCLTTVKNATELEGSEIEWQYADKENIESTFKTIQQKAKAEDVIVVYLSGHGVARSGRDQTQFYYLTQGVASEESLNDPRTLGAYTISTEEFTTWINAIPALKQVLIIDACNSGQLVENITNKAVTLNSSQIRALDRMRDRTGMFLLSGSASDKVSYEASQYGQGLLTYALLQGMRGVAARKDEGDKELIDVMKLFQYARDEVPRLASTINGIQTPMLGFPSQGASFDIGILDDKAKAKISIGHEKPIMIRSIFMNEATYKDNLQLVTLLESSFRKESAKGAKAQLIYVDVNDYPGAYALRGLYSIEGEKIKIKLKLFWGQESFDLAIPAATNAKELVGEIKWVVQEKIAELEGG